MTPLFDLLILSVVLWFPQKDVEPRPVEKEFMMFVSYCLDDALWQDNSPAEPGAGRAPESSIESYVWRMQQCLGRHKEWGKTWEPKERP